MKRLWIAAVAGLCSFGQLNAQELAPTAPVVPAPMLQNGSLLVPESGKGAWGGSRPFLGTRWSPVRSPVVENTILPMTAPSALSYPQALPPLPAGVMSPDDCGAAGCGRGHGGLSWSRLKAWLCFAPSKTELPKCRPTPYVTPLQGMFPCTAAGGYGCAPGCAPGAPAYGHPQPLPAPMPQLVPPGVGTGPTAGAVMMPPRGAQGMAMSPTWKPRLMPEAKVSARPAPGPVVPALLKVPQR